ncbi:MAG TPA: hypothetical protein VFP83_06125 [Candidatus Limnocylindria bacterium]|nr:hypothetical protein [Candidatus Limnocylindria bacterium]
MTVGCERIAREVIEFFRFGDLDARSAPHLAHLAVCADCREAVGLDRTVVVQLQRALAARVDGHAASPGAWIEIRRRALEPEAPTLLGRLLPVLRLAPVGATAIVVLALLVAPNLNPFRVQPHLAGGEPTWRILEEVEAMDVADGVQARWWLRYITVAAPHTGAVATFDRWELVATSALVGGHSR